MSNPKTNYLNVLSVEEFRTADGKMSRNWTKLGVAFPHADGCGFNIMLTAFPCDGKLVVLPPQNEAGERGTDARTKAPATKTL